MDDLERAVINATMNAHRGCAPETCGGSGLDPCALGNAIEAYLDAQRPEPGELIWVRRTWDDVRTGDVVRMPGSDAVATIAERRWPATDDHRGRGSMHVTSDGTREKWAHTRDRVVQEGECVIRFTFDPPEHTRYMIPTSPVEIQMDVNEINALNALGWANRERTITS